jgi:hypothetical protein
MKKQMKKLTLAKETLRSLEGELLGTVAGGTVISIQLACPSGERPSPIIGFCLPPIHT